MVYNIMYYHGFKMHGLINDLFLPGLWSVCSCSDLAEVITGWVGHEHRALEDDPMEFNLL